MARQGGQSVGHPVDVATGTVTVQARDVFVPCRIELSWTRNYSSHRASQPSSIGLGWLSEYDATLIRDLDGFTFTFPSGSQVQFDDPGRSVEQGSILVNYGAFLELFKRHDDYVVSEWSIRSTVITRYIFRAVVDSSEFRLLRIEDVTGQGLSLQHDQSGRTVRIIEDRGRRGLSLNYGPTGLVESIWFGLDRSYSERLARFEYDRQGRLVAAFDPGNAPTRYAYDEENRLTSEVTRDGGTFHFTYDSDGRCVHTSGLDDYDAQSLVYRPFANETEVINSVGGRWIYQFREDGQVSRILTPLGFAKSYEYDEYGRITAETEANGAAIRFEFDESGNLAAIVNPLGFRDEFLFNIDRRATSHRDKAGNVWVRDYDDRNRMVAALDPLNNQWRYTYSSEGDLVAVIDPLGNRKEFEYNEYGDMISRTNFAGSRRHYERDSQGRVVVYSDALGNRTVIERDGRGYASKLLQPDGGTWRLGYDSEGNLLEKIDPAGNRTVSRYLPCGRLYERIHADGSLITVKWSSVPGQMLSVTNEVGEVHSFEYDIEGRIVRELAFDRREMRFEYDNAAWCTAVSDAGLVTKFKRDLLGQIVQKQFADGSTAAFEYDPVGWLTKGENSGCVVTFQRDAAGNLVKEKSGPYEINSEFDSNGNRISRRSSLGARERFTVDPDGNVLRLELGEFETIAFARDREGLEIERRFRSGMRMEQSFNRNGSLEALTVRSRHGREIIDRKYSYLSTGQLARTLDRQAGVTEYSYDVRKQLTHVSDAGLAVEEYRFDAAGNLLHARQNNGVFEYSIAAGGRPTARTGTRYEYDETGRTVRKTASDGQTWSYEWNAEGLLEAVTTPEGGRWEYVYDAFGRRVRKCGPSGVVDYVWDDFVPAHERTDEDVVTWIYEPATYRPIAKISSRGVFNCITDQIGVPRELVSTAGEVRWKASQTAWAEEKHQDQRGLRAWESLEEQCPVRFQGQWYDYESGLCYNRFRYYDPERTTFISPDPAGLNGCLRLYEYPRDPLGFIDPSGLVPLNDPGYTVYGIYQKGPDGNPFGDPIYVGITNDVSRRTGEHTDTGRLNDDRILAPLPGESDLTYKQARGREQAYIEEFKTKPPDKKGTPPGNVINSFDHDRKDRRGKTFEKEYKQKKAELDANKLACK